MYHKSSFGSFLSHHGPKQFSENISWESIRETAFEPYPNPKNSPLGPQKVKNDPKIKSKSNVRIEGNIENESCSTT